MSKKTMAVIILVLAAILLLLLVLAVVLATRTQEGSQDQLQGTTALPVADGPDSTENPAESNTEISGIPGIADNPFGNNDNNNNNDTTPPAQGNSGNNGNESGGHDAESTRPTTTHPGSQDNKPEETEPEETEPQDTKPAGNSPSYSSVTYEQYEAMSEAEQKAFVNSFASLDDFFDWYYAAKEKYEQETP